MENQQLYFIALLPTEKIRQEVAAISNDFAENYHSKHALKSPPHITLYMPFKKNVKQEDEMVNTLSQFALSVNPFELELKGFGCFAPRVIFIDVVSNERLQEMYKDLLACLSNKLDIYDKQAWQRPYKPHLTVAHRDLKPTAFKNAWEKYKSKTYDRKFIVESFTLLKHNGRHWEEFKVFHFGA